MKIKNIRGVGDSQWFAVEFDNGSGFLAPAAWLHAQINAEGLGEAQRTEKPRNLDLVKDST